MKKLLLFSIVLFGSPFLLTAQNVGVDVLAPTQKLDVAGAIRLGSTTTGGAGSLRWNGTNFQVHNGTQWITFGTGTDNDWAVVGNDMYSEPTGNVGIGIALPVAKFQVVGTSRLSALNINGNYTLPTIDGATGFVLTTNGSGVVAWSNPALVGDITAVIAGNGLINGGNSGDVTLDVNPGDGIVITSDEVRVRASDLEGNGLSVTGNDFNVNVDNSTIEINADALRVKAEGITANEIATGAVTTSEILNGTILTGDISIGGVTSSNILNSTILPADIANAGNDQVLVTNASGVPTWQNQTTLFGGQAGDGLVNDVPNSEIDVNPGDGIAVTGDQVVVVASDLEGNGLSVTSNNFNVNVDNTTLEINADALRVKANGILSSHIAPDVIVAADIATGAVTTAEILNATILPADVAAGANNTVLSTNASGVVGWNNPATLTTVLQDGDADTKVTVDVGGVDEDHIRLSTFGAERMTIDNAGEIGIGTNTPDRNLHVAGATGGVIIVTRNDGGTTSGETLGEIQFDSEASSGPSAVEASAVIRGIASETHGNANKGGHLAFATKTGGGTSGGNPATERMRITNAGNVIIHGSTSTIGGSDINNGWLTIGDNASSGVGIDNNEIYFKGVDGIFGVLGNNSLSVNVNGGTRMFFKTDGNVGIGTTGPLQKLHVVGNARISGLASPNNLVLANASGDLYTSSSLVGTGLGDNLGNHIATTNLTMSSNEITGVDRISTLGESDYDKIRVYSTGSYTIGMASGQSLGYLNDWAMTFTMNNDTDRGFLWRDESDAVSDGAMSLTTDGRLYLKSTAHFNGSVGIGTAPSGKFHIVGDFFNQDLTGYNMYNSDQSVAYNASSATVDLGATDYVRIAKADGAGTNGSSILIIGSVSVSGNTITFADGVGGYQQVYALMNGMATFTVRLRRRINSGAWTTLLEQSAVCGIAIGDWYTQYNGIANMQGKHGDEFRFPNSVSISYFDDPANGTIDYDLLFIPGGERKNGGNYLITDRNLTAVQIKR